MSTSQKAAPNPRFLLAALGHTTEEDTNALWIGNAQLAQTNRTSEELH